MSLGEFEELDHAYWFSNAFYGASLLYNLLVAEKYDANESLTRIEYATETYRERIDGWAEQFLVPFHDGLLRWDIETALAAGRGRQPEHQPSYPVLRRIVVGRNPEGRSPDSLTTQRSPPPRASPRAAEGEAVPAPQRKAACNLVGGLRRRPARLQMGNGPDHW